MNSQVLSDSMLENVNGGDWALIGAGIGAAVVVTVLVVQLIRCCFCGDPDHVCDHVCCFVTLGALGARGD